MAAVHERRKERERNSGMVRKTIWLRSRTDGSWYVHPDLRDRLIADAAAQESNVNDVARRILATRYKFRYVPAPVRRETTGSEWQMVFTLEAALLGEIAKQGRRAGRTENDELRAALCAHYGLRVPARPQHRRSA